MNNIRLFIMVAVLFSTWASSLPGQTNDQQPTPPKGRLLAAASNYAKWQIHFTYGEEDTSGGANPGNPTPTPDLSAQLPPRDVVVTFTRPLWHAVLVDIVGRKSETWFDGLTAYIILPKAPQPNPVAGDATDDLPDYLNYMGKKTDFPDMDWVSVQSYTGQEPINGTNCFVFKKTGDQEITAWIDAETRLPVRWVKGKETRDYTFLSPPTAKLDLPEAIKRIARAMEMVRQNNNRKPPRGG